MWKAGDSALGELCGDVEIRAWNRRSKGRRDGVGLRLYAENNAPLPGEDATELFVDQLVRSARLSVQLLTWNEGVSSGIDSEPSALDGKRSICGDDGEPL